MPQQLSQEQLLRPPADQNFLRLKELLLDDKHYHSEKLVIYWLPCDSILIEDDKRPIFGPFAVRIHAHTLVVS